MSQQFVDAIRAALEEAVQDRLEALWREIALVIGGAVSAPVLFGQDG